MFDEPSTSQGGEIGTLNETQTDVVKPAFNRYNFYLEMSLY